MSQLLTAEDRALLEEVIEKMSETRAQRKEAGLPPMTSDECLAETQKITRDYMSRQGPRRRLVEARKEIKRLKAELGSK